MKRFDRELGKLASLYNQSYRTLSDGERMSALERRLGRTLALANGDFFRASHAIAFATRGVGSYPTAQQLHRAKQAHSLLSKAEKALGHPFYPLLGRMRVERLISARSS